MEQLRKLLKQIDGKGYPAYKSLQGSYRFPGYELRIEHVQGDPFAAPSKLSVQIAEGEHRIPKELYETMEKRVAVQDYLLRGFSQSLRKQSKRAKGSGKSGVFEITRPGQEILERSACQLDEKSRQLIVRFEAGFPANGRRIAARELEKMLFEFLPECVKKSLYYQAVKQNALKDFVRLACDYMMIEGQLEEKNLVAFVANDSVLPRKSGVLDTPLKEGIPFASPKSLEIKMELSESRSVIGMGIPQGITLIIGGGYHGKSTLLKALERGVYPHIPGDGREYVVTRSDGVKLRAEDGRNICGTDISGFIQHLPNGKDTLSFVTEDASGSTSQAANVAEAMEAKSKLFLIDEDTSATNFMVRDALMQQVVSREKEPIIPYVDRIRPLYEQYGISTILVAGSSGSFFEKADTIIQMDAYEPKEITAFAKKLACAANEKSGQILEMPFPNQNRRPVSTLRENPRTKIKVLDEKGFLIEKEKVDLAGVEQIVDREQVQMLGKMLYMLETTVFDGKKTMQEAVDALYQRLEAKGFEGIAGKSRVPGNWSIPRKQELFACINRYRGLQVK